MGKATGFMDYDRQDKMAEDPKERIKHFKEFHTPLSKEEQELQGARCMACGVPFCQSGQMLMGMASGCPLHNLVPEWNDLIFQENWEEAYYRLKKTNNFPEFTSRVCPALCEAACTCGLNGDAVSSKANEYSIIENAYKKGYAAAMESTLRLTELVDKLEKAPQNADKAAVEKELSEIEALLKSINNDRGQVLADRYNSVVGEVRQVLADPSDNNLNNMIEGFNGYIDTYNSTTPDQFDAK